RSRRPGAATRPPPATITSNRPRARTALPPSRRRPEKISFWTNEIRQRRYLKIGRIGYHALNQNGPPPGTARPAMGTASTRGEPGGGHAVQHNSGSHRTPRPHDFDLGDG